MTRSRAFVLPVFLLAVAALALGSCASGDDDGDDDSGFPADDDAGGGRPDDDLGDDTIDDDADDDSEFTPWVNPAAKADAFRLFYAERTDRVLTAYNRFMLVNDVVPAHTLGGLSIDKQGGAYDVALHPVDNNEIGTATFNAYQAYRVFRTRALALTLIRQFEGLAVAEKVSGIPGLTCREWEPGFILTIDGPSGTVTRTRFGAPVAPAESYPEELEAEIIDTFFADGVYRYNADPADYYFTVESILNPGDFAVTGVFAEWPRYLRVSNCCSSFMVTPEGPYAGYFWGNHNSRDNFPDFGMGYLAAVEAAADEGADADVRAAAQRAVESGRRIGDSVVQYGYNLMTVGEFQPYDAEHLIVAGELRPDGTDEGLEWLGSMNMCPMSYMAKALSSEGLSSPDEEVQVPGSYEIIAVKKILQLIGIDPPPPLSRSCRGIDDAMFGLSWRDFMERDLLGKTFLEWIAVLLEIAPDPAVDLIRSLAGSIDQPEKAAFALVYYAGLQGNDELLRASRQTLYHLVELHRRAALMIGDWGAMQDPPRQDLLDFAHREIVAAARFAHAGGVGNAEFDVDGFAQDDRASSGFEAVLTRGNSTPRGLFTDDEIWQRILNELAGNDERPIVVDRYWARFPTPDDRPMWREGDHYRVIGLDGEFQEIDNIGHQGFGGVHLWDAVSNCAQQPTVLDCSWAVLGCSRPDLDGSRAVDDGDGALFDAAWTTFGDGAACDAGNAWCDGADLDRSGTLDAADRAFLDAARGCWY
jgi:hypothetical protein